MTLEEERTQIKNKHGLLARYGEFITLALLIVAVSAINLVWFVQDTRPQPGSDANIYLVGTLDFLDRLREEGGNQFWQSFTEMSFGGRPPLYQLLTVPFLYLFGRSVDAALSVNIFFVAILLLSTYAIGKLTLNGKAGLLAAFLVATYPPIVGAQRIYRPNFATPACVALSLWLLLLLLKTRSVKVAWLFGASLGFGMLTRHFFGLHLAVPTAVFGIYMALFQAEPKRPRSIRGAPGWLLIKLRDPFVLYGLLPAAIIAAGLTASWYLTEAADPFLALGQRIQSADTATRGFQDVASHSFWWYALTAPGAISYVFTILLAIGLVLGIIRWQLYSSVLVVTFLASYVILSLQKGLTWYRFAAVLPVSAALTAIWIADIRNKRLSVALTLACVCVAAFNFSVVTWGVQSWSRPIALALGAPLDSDTCSRREPVAFCPDPARDEDWKVSDILRAIHDDAECQERECDLVIVPDTKSFNWHIFRSYLSFDFPESRMKIRSAYNPGIGANPLDASWLLSDYAVTVPEWPSRGYQGAVAQVLQAPPSAFDNAHREVASFALPGGQTARLIKRTKPLTVQEAEAVIAALNLPSEELAYLLQQFDPLRVRELLDDGSVAEAFDLAMQLLDGDTLNSREKAAQAVSIGNQLLNMGETARAIELLNQVAPDTDNALVWVLLGRAYAGQQNRIEAISAYEKALALDPQNYWANHLLAGLYANLEEWDVVVQLERAALQVAADDNHRVASAIRLMEAYESLGEQENACAVLQQIEQWAEEGNGGFRELHERLECQP
jgi:hypothetical protein